MTHQTLAGRRLLYVVTEDWFFRSHFLPMATAARSAGLDVAVLCRCGEAKADLEAAGCRVLPLSGARRSALSPLSGLREVAATRRAIRDHRIDITHFIALRPILIGLALSALGASGPAVFALTGRGLLGVDPRRRAGALRAMLRLLARRAARAPNVFVFENHDDPAFLGLSGVSDARIAVIGGAGVDPEAWPEQPTPPRNGPLRVAFVGRMLAFKGVADAVKAVEIATSLGASVELSLFGEPDPDNPASISLSALQAWGRLPNVRWFGRADDVAGVWARSHVCIQPSHEVEGLPRALLEAAACGRALIATDTPGCREFVRDGVEGLLAPPRRPDRLAQAMATMSADHTLVESFGAAARRRILAGFTTQAVAAGILSVYERALAHTKVAPDNANL